LKHKQGKVILIGFNIECTANTPIKRYFAKMAIFLFVKMGIFGYTHCTGAGYSLFFFGGYLSPAAGIGYMQADSQTPAARVRLI
jgi:hypothetical protein